MSANPLPVNHRLDWFVTVTAIGATKGDWNEYERLKRRLHTLKCTPQEYEWALHRLCEALEL